MITVGHCAVLLFSAFVPTAASAASAGFSAGNASFAQRSDTLVKLATRPRHPDGANLVHELTIGSAEAPEHYSFTSIADVLLARDGTVIVIDHGARPLGTPFVRQYSADGKYVRTIGGRGEGPGEYRSPSGIAQLPDGRILIRDGAQRRLNLYSEAGEPLDTWRLDPGLTIVNASGHLLTDAAGIIYRWDFTRKQTPAENSPPFGIIRMLSDGTVIDTIPPPELPDLPIPTLTARGNGTRMTRVPYTPTTTWTWSPLGYAVTGRTDRYAIDLRVPARSRPVATRGVPPSWKEGDQVIIIRRDVPPIRISAAERDARRSGVETFLRASDPQWSWSGPDIPRIKPYFRAIRAGADGRIWVSASVASEALTPEPTPNPAGRSDSRVPFREPTVYDVFEPDGTYLGQLRIPDQMNLVAMKGDTAWAVVRDDDDVQTLLRFRIVWK